MKTKTNLLFGVHMHQPVDNFGKAVDEAVKKCYEPFFKTLKKYPSLNITVHSSGWLLEYICNNHKKLFKIIKEMAQKGVIEFFTGGFYEPVLPSIPSKDRIAQIEKLNKLIYKEFSQRPKGAWLSERVWDDSLVNDFFKTGIEYVMVDDYHLITCGFDKSELDGYFYTEYNAKKLALFPINKDLRYALPFKNIKDAFTDIKEYKTAIIFDDLEKFGLWPKTYEWVYEKGWLDKFFKELTNDEEVKTVHFDDYYRLNKPISLSYLQNVSYFEMGEWSLKAKNALKLEQIRDEIGKRFPNSIDKFVKGGTWKNFFIKYEESNRLHKRMLEVSNTNIKSKKFLENLYKLQTNDVFWHGVFGGIYLPNLRDNAYRYLSICEDIKYKDKEGIFDSDNDMNGYDEIKCVKKNYIAIFDSHYAGQLSEFLLRDKKFNFQNVLTRREELYHKEIKNILKNDKDGFIDEKRNEIETIHNLNIKINDEIVDYLHYDWYVKNSFVDHISNESFTLENFKKCSFWEYGDFANQPFEYTIKDNIIIFKRKGGIYFDKKYNSVLQKKYKIKDDGFDFVLDFKSEDNKAYKYALEFNLHFAELKNVYFEKIKIIEEFEKDNIKEFSLFDTFTSKKLTFTFDNCFKVLSTPLYTVSKSEKGYDKMIQGVSFAFVFDFSKEFQICGKLRLEDV